MKHLSIKLKITLYITLVMAILSVLMMMFAVNIAVRAADNELKETLREEVDELYGKVGYVEIEPDRTEQLDPESPTAPPSEDEWALDEMRPGNGKSLGKNPDKAKDEFVLEIPENTKYEINGVMLYIAGDSDDKEEQMEEGDLPEGINIPDEKNVDTVTEVDNYYVYARFLPMPMEQGGGAWVVGAIDTGMSHSIAYDTLMQAVLSIPLIIILTAVLGYFVTRRAFKPISKITKAASNIANSNNLSERLDMGDGKDEISVLASTFDEMLDTIERNFEKEKQFTADASHELRTPVAVIMAQSELAMDPNATHEDCVEAMKSVNRQSRKMNKLLSELLSLARSDNKCEVLEREKFDLYELADMVIDEQKTYADERHITIELTGEEGTEINADKTQMMRVLINLISNAVKYGKDGGTVTVSVKKDDDRKVVCSVTDDGIGISKEDLKRIWNRFYRADTARTADYSGSMGLGLSMVKSIVESHGGKVNAESVLGEGSVFSFTL